MYGIQFPLNFLAHVSMNTKYRNIKLSTALESHLVYDIDANKDKF